MMEYSLHWIFYKEPNIFLFLKKLFCFQLHVYVLGHADMFGPWRPKEGTGSPRVGVTDVVIHDVGSGH